jgi:hypothetical protein
MTKVLNGVEVFRVDFVILLKKLKVQRDACEITAYFVVKVLPLITTSTFEPAGAVPP